jgi:ABC transporter
MSTNDLLCHNHLIDRAKIPTIGLPQNLSGANAEAKRGSDRRQPGAGYELVAEFYDAAAGGDFYSSTRVRALRGLTFRTEMSAHKHGICSMTTVVRCPRTGRACSEGTCRERHWCREMLESGGCQGRSVVVCGPSGSGKSTLIKCVNGLEPFQEGTITGAGISVSDRKTDLPKLRARIGMVFSIKGVRVDAARRYD